MNQERPKLAIAAAVILSLFFAGYVIKDLEHGYISGATPVTMRQYSSEDGVTFKYPDTYSLSSKHHSMAGASWDSVEFVNKNVTVPQNSDGPESISLQVFDDSAGLPLDKYIKNDVRTNFQLSSSHSLSSSTIGGEPALIYQYTGLYENDVVAVLHNKKVFLFSVSWSQTVEPIRHDFSSMLSTVTFQ